MVLGVGGVDAEEVVSHCAICTSERGPFTSQPLGKGNALVSVCAECDEPAFEKRGPERAYEGAGPSAPSEGAMTVAMRRLMGDAEYERRTTFEEAFGRKGAHSLTDDEYAIQDFQWETQRRHFSRAGYSNRTTAEKAKK